MLGTIAHLFFPRPSNNHKAQLLHSSSLTALIVFVILLQGATGLIANNGSVLGYAANINVTEVIRLTNAERTKNGLSVLTNNEVLNIAASEKGRDMLAKGYWAHVAPDGTQPWAFFTSSGYEYRYAGENLARDFSDPESAVKAWMASSTHRQNLLSTNYKEIGIGVVEGKLDGVETTIIVQFFGTKLVDSLPTQPVADTATPVPAVVSAPAVQSENISSPALVAASQVTPFSVTKYLSFGLIGVLMVVVAVDGFFINKRKIYRLAGHFPAHIAFLGMILTIIVIAKAGRII